MNESDTLTIPLTVAADLGILSKLRKLGYEVPTEQEVDVERLSREGAMRETVRRLALEREMAIAEASGAYAERNKCVALVARGAMAFGYKVGLGHDEKEPPEWQTVVFIDLPTGQVSWHVHESERSMFAALPAYDGQWDGHSTEEKYRRVVEFIGAAGNGNASP